MTKTTRFASQDRPGVDADWSRRCVRVEFDWGAIEAMDSPALKLAAMLRGLGLWLTGKYLTSRQTLLSRAVAVSMVLAPEKFGALRRPDIAQAAGVSDSMLGIALRDARKLLQP